LRVGLGNFRAFWPDHEVDQGIVGVTAIDGERRDARARNHREGEEPRPDDVAQRLEAADAFANAFEPSVGAN
jgi:hypothetical protein